MPALRAVTDTPQRALIYLRQSQKRDESISLEVQETACRDFCARHGYAIVDVVADQITGQKWEKRPGVQQVMRRIQAGEATRVILYRWSRISRVRLHQAQAIHLIQQVGADVESATEPFDTRTAAGEFGRDMMLDFAVFQGKLIGQQWKEAHTKRRDAGLPHSGGNRFGYRLTDRVYIPDPELAETYRWMYEEYVGEDDDVRGFQSIRDSLNRRGILNSRGKPWITSTLTRVMDSGFAAGLLSRPISGGKFSYAQGSHPPIISTDLWNSYLAARRVRATKPNEVSPKYRLSGLVRCGDCGGAMVSAHGSTGGAGYTYQCANWRNGKQVDGKTVRCVTVKRLRVEDAVKTWLRELSGDVDKASEASTRIERSRAANLASVAITSREILAIDAQLTELTKQLIAGRVPESIYDSTRDELMQERDQLQKRLDSATHESRTRKPINAAAVALDLVNNWDALPLDGCRRLVSRLMKHVVVTPNPKPYGRAKLLVVPTWDTRS